MEDKLCFVQFLHPGGEHWPDKGDRKSWNRAEFPHRRTFVKNRGRYVAGDVVEENDIVFWCEWEPEAELVQTIDSPSRVGPNHIFEPYYVVPESYWGLHNTDPFVFGDEFYYTWCRQIRRSGAQTQLCYLAAGSVILFGSCRDESFILDAVLVVDQAVWHRRDNYRDVLRGLIPQAYAEVTIAPSYGEHATKDFGCGPKRAGAKPKRACAEPSPVAANRLYFGAMYDRPYAGMYSFFPCKPYNPHDAIFERPRIQIPGVIADRKTMGYTLNPQPNREESKKLWDKVVKQVTDQNLMLGVWAAMPERRDSAGSKPIHKENPRGFHC